MEFAQANTKSYVEFVQKLAGAKSPSEFIEISNELRSSHQINGHT
jgi:hypothetical protein